jgi:hypothetical protein
MVSTSKLSNPSCDLPKEVDAASKDEQGNFEFKSLGGNGMNGLGK